MKNPQILWVDDEIELLKPHILFLTDKGYDVQTCNNGYDAIDMARTTHFDLIILDEMMPGITGLETLPQIKEVSPTTPVVMVTKSEEENIMNRAVGSKIADYLIKPVNPNQVLLSIKRTCTRGSLSPLRPRPIIVRLLVRYHQWWSRPVILRIGRPSTAR